MGESVLAPISENVKRGRVLEDEVFIENSYHGAGSKNTG